MIWPTRKQIRLGTMTMSTGLVGGALGVLSLMTANWVIFAFLCGIGATFAYNTIQQYAHCPEDEEAYDVDDRELRVEGSRVHYESGRVRAQG